jgi:hypothetical protein
LTCLAICHILLVMTSAAAPLPSPAGLNAPDSGDVAALTSLLDLMRDFPSNEQRARYLLTSDWLRERGAEAARINADQLATLRGSA